MYIHCLWFVCLPLNPHHYHPIPKFFQTLFLFAFLLLTQWYVDYPGQQGPPGVCRIQTHALPSLLSYQCLSDTHLPYPYPSSGLLWFFCVCLSLQHSFTAADFVDGVFSCYVAWSCRSFVCPWQQESWFVVYVICMWCWWLVWHCSTSNIGKDF